ncbi:metal ABC transporter permease [Persephonella sp.]|uniref:metal ABC transporter permease n=1 Tax=Persephonella sp. TaxID=2060922 RepID=UPI0025DB9F6E|nr:metal ABC transporter permease [Persephonella sp.]
MTELISIPFVQNALIGGIILSILLSILSLFIYLKSWSFINVGISHATFGGLALGFYLGLSPTLFGILFAVITGFLIGYISRKGQIHEDVSIGILFSVSMALGVILITLSPNYNTDLFTFLFGNILTISREDIYILAFFTVFSLAFIYTFFDKIMYCCYNEEVAYVSGINTTFYYYSLILIISVATVLSVKLVGVILASAMMILPAAFSNQIFWHYKGIIILSMLTSIVMVVAGIFVSFYFDLPSGATIVFLYSSLFGFTVLIKKVLQKV